MANELEGLLKKDDGLPRSLREVAASIRRNCQISDAGFSGIFSMCTLILRLRNLYKWEHDMAPWTEPATNDLLEWIDAKEKVWETLLDASLHPLTLNGQAVDPLDSSAVNLWFKDSGLLYGAGFGRSMKPVFFLAEKLEEKTVENIPLFILGKEQVRELAAPFAMAQENAIYIRKEPMRFYFWDQIQEIGSGGKKALKRALEIYGIIGSSGSPDRDRVIAALDEIVDEELKTFVYHEVGELKEESLGSAISKTVIHAYPHSPIEYLTRAVKDLLADTHPVGLFRHIIEDRKETSLSFYVGFLDGMRSMLFPQIRPAYRDFLEDADWDHIRRAVDICRNNMLHQAGKIVHVADLLREKGNSRTLETYIEDEILSPLGLGKQES